MGADGEPSPTRKRGRDEEELAAEKRPREEGWEGASLLGLASYEDDDDEEQAARGHSNGRRVEEEEDEDDARRAPERRSRQVELRRDCPYLDTVNRQVSRILHSLLSPDVKLAWLKPYYCSFCSNSAMKAITHISVILSTSRSTNV
jgi:U4/U6.U5 tri-snRNP-associated protein 2